MTLEDWLSILPQLNLLAQKIAETNKHVISNSQAQAETADTTQKVSARLTLRLGKQTSEPSQGNETDQAQEKQPEKSECLGKQDRKS